MNVRVMPGEQDLPSHVLHEPYFPAGEVLIWKGYAFAATDVTKDFGTPPNDTVNIGDMDWQAWELYP